MRPYSLLGDTKDVGERHGSKSEQMKRDRPVLGEHFVVWVCAPVGGRGL